MAATGEVVTGGVILDDVALTGSTVTSNVVRIDRCHVASIDLSMVSGTDTAVGTIAIQVCNDLANANWVSVAFTDSTTTVSSVSFDLSAAEVGKFFNLENLGAAYMRVLITLSATGASDTVRATAHVKNR